MPGPHLPNHAGTPLPPHLSAGAVVRAREYGQSLATVVRGLPLGVVTAVTGGDIVFADATFAALLGHMEPSALEGRNIFALAYSDDLGLDKAYAAQVLRGERAGCTLEKRFVRVDGTAIWCTISATVVRDAAGLPEFAFGIVQDFSDRKAAEEATARALAQAEEARHILEAVMTRVPEGITIADAPDVRIRMVSAPSTLEAIPADLQPDAWEIYRADGVTRAGSDELPLTRVTVYGEVVKGEEWVLGRPDGSRITILCNAGPIRDAEGQIKGGVIASRDRDELLARITHDLRTPITADYGYASLMRDGIDDSLPASGMEPVRRMLANQQLPHSGGVRAAVAGGRAITIAHVSIKSGHAQYVLPIAHGIAVISTHGVQCCPNPPVSE